ncbi:MULTISPECIES: glycosyltransferase family 4 protein [unclassified Campylobacter]|uniref:glycosyltransferase family 4 protein n=1 Tax=unclassified Campylobacter TaxID=2593542 RepID=UPI0022E9F7D5|nr:MULTISPECIES: glycosyltransferase family 4 protein [unclassified Campylobacter]MDA3055708.1 glycosyltransferase family 4 protein [Campylobacter sp. CN_NA1]MDA3065028.1 glycosyltransferase family 4 protein [Campylobacter sp. CN_NE4]MDA3068564.1 glycosyltransferase family 4 protein [Campylobacter sp. CN_NE3]MDA3082113.1 glycosyltransferase family 4 protein [Campylobacter sp. CN_EL2]MDA3084149.1 glycosyltransferase family 4 protein [Campylobacter sp. CN_NE1]
MNIAIATDNFKPSGGMERYVFDLVQGFLAKQITPSVFSMKISPEFAKLCPTHKISQFPISQLRYAVFNAILQKKLPKNHKLIATSLVDNADILFCGGNHLGFLKGIKRQATIKDKMTIKRGFSAYKSAKKIVAHSQKMTDELVEFYGVEKDKIFTIYPPVDTEKFYPMPDEKRAKLRKKFGFNENENILLFPSGDHQRKGLPFILEAVKIVNLKLNYKIKIAVCGNKKVQNDSIINLGFIKNMPDLYNAVDFSILASLYEPFGLVGVESILCGTKIIFANSCGCCEIIKDSDGLFFDKNNLESLINSLILADQMKSSNQHKINNPQEYIAYNPKLAYHIDELLKLLD